MSRYVRLLTLRLTPAEFSKVDAVAKRFGKFYDEWARDALVSIADEYLQPLADRTIREKLLAERAELEGRTKKIDEALSVLPAPNSSVPAESGNDFQRMAPE